MKNSGPHPLLILTLLFCVFVFGLFLGRLSPLRGNNLSVEQIQPVTVPLQAETGVPLSVTTGVININTADIEELMLLPGIGQVLAQRIIAYRDANGNFSSTEDIMNIKGIGAETFAKLSQFITVGG